MCPKCKNKIDRKGKAMCDKCLRALHRGLGGNQHEEMDHHNWLFCTLHGVDPYEKLDAFNPEGKTL